MIMIKDSDIKLDKIFKLNPGSGSHSPEPYLVKIIEVYPWGFYTEVFGGAYPNPSYCKPHRRRFSFDSHEWSDYHKQRFEEI